jgi:hypothetical protein
MLGVIFSVFDSAARVSTGWDYGCYVCTGWLANSRPRRAVELRFTQRNDVPVGPCVGSRCAGRREAVIAPCRGFAFSPAGVASIVHGEICAGLAWQLSGPRRAW